MKINAPSKNAFQNIGTHQNYYAVKHMITLSIPKLFYFFSVQYIRMSGKNISFDDKKKFKK